MQSEGFPSGQSCLLVRALNTVHPAWEPFMQLSEILSAATVKDGKMSATVSEFWTQGRTSYGGLSTALCYHAATQVLSEPRALRSAMISFVGPSAGPVEVTPELMRAGRTAASARARLSTPDNMGTEASFTFSNLRDSKLDQPALSYPDDIPPRPDSGTPQTIYPDFAPAFTKQFEWIWHPGKAPFVPGPSPRVAAWVRHRDVASRDTMSGLLCLADGLPPAVSPTMPEFAPLSSMTWMIDLLRDDISTDEGWYLLEATSDFAGGGHSSQDMTVWNTRGQCIAKGRQMVTVFL